MLADADLQTIVWTSRMEAAKHFYGEALGLPFKGESHGAAIFGVGGRELRVSPVPSTAPSAHTVLGFAVADARAVVAALTAKGVAIERFPGFPHDAEGLIATPEGAEAAWFRDPDGNLLSVVQYGANAAG
jgi:catechol 2,3-dioxygenase-like lactoylglutathione lyase family enzyme